METRSQAFWEKHPGVVWSNAAASDSAMIAHALLRPNFHLLLAIAEHFGLERLKADWATLRSAVPKNGDASAERMLRRAEPIVERCLSHMEQALRHEKSH